MMQQNRNLPKSG